MIFFCLLHHGDNKRNSNIKDAKIKLQRKVGLGNKGKKRGGVAWYQVLNGAAKLQIQEKPRRDKDKLSIGSEAIE